MRKSIAAAAAAATITAGLALAAPAQAAPAARTLPASQAPGSPQDQIWCLTNHSVSCIAFDPYQFTEAVSAAVVAAKIIFDWISQGRSGGDQKGEDKNEGTEDGNSGDKDAGLCLANTGGGSYWAACGANGTTFIAIPHGGGFWLESQYELNRGWSGAVLSTGSTGNYATLWLDPAGDTAFWQTWTWSALTACCGTAAARA